MKKLIHYDLVISYVVIESTMVQVMACCLTAPSHNLNRYWLIVTWALHEYTSVKFDQNTKLFSNKNAIKKIVQKRTHPHGWRASSPQKKTPTPPTICNTFRIAASLRGQCVNTLRPRQNGCHFADDTLKPFFLNDNVRISIKISLKFVPWGIINNIPALVQIMAWRRPGDKPLFEQMMVSSLMHICVTRPQWVNTQSLRNPTPRAHTI